MFQVFFDKDTLNITAKECIHQVKRMVHPFSPKSNMNRIMFVLSLKLKTMNTFRKTIGACLISLNLFSSYAQQQDQPRDAGTQHPSTTSDSDTSNHIQVALLLDTSGSMDGLIDQAKARLWTIVNTLTTLKYDGKTPMIEIALYEYGNDGNSVKDNFIRQISPLTTDLDVLSEKLFALRTNGGSEFCGAVIQSALEQLKWKKGKHDMKLIYIAGNEPFNQGGVNYKESILKAVQQNVYVNTIYCGNESEGINTYWQDGAAIGKGKYFFINSNQAVTSINTPYDTQINEYNLKMNATYIEYGSEGKMKKEVQVQQDRNAASVSSSNYTERVVSKSKSTVYKNKNWDLVDKVDEDGKAVLKDIKKEELPAELQNKTNEEIEAIIVEKAKERSTIQKEINDLAVKRQAFIDSELKKTNQTDDLGTAIKNSVIEVAKTLGYTVSIQN